MTRCYLVKSAPCSSQHHRSHGACNLPRVVNDSQALPCTLNLNHTWAQCCFVKDWTVGERLWHHYFGGAGMLVADLQCRHISVLKGRGAGCQQLRSPLYFSVNRRARPRAPPHIASQRRSAVANSLRCFRGVEHQLNCFLEHCRHAQHEVQQWCQSASGSVRCNAFGQHQPQTSRGGHRMRGIAASKR